MKIVSQLIISIITDYGGNKYIFYSAWLNKNDQYHKIGYPAVIFYQDIHPKSASYFRNGKRFKSKNEPNIIVFNEGGKEKYNKWISSYVPSLAFVQKITKNSIERYWEYWNYLDERNSSINAHINEWLGNKNIEITDEYDIPKEHSVEFKILFG